MKVGKHVNGIRFGIGLLLTAILSLSVHTVMLQELHIPFPDVAVIAKPYLIIIRVCSFCGLLYFWKLACRKVHGSFVRRWFLLFILDTMLTESLFRSPFMDGYCTNAIGFMFVSNVPKLLSIAVVCGLIVMVTPKVNKAWQKLGGGIVAGAIYTYLASPLFNAAWRPVLSLVDRFAPKGEWCTLPYGPDVLIPAYITYLEPVIACSIMALLIWRELTKSRWARYGWFTLMVLTIKNQLITPILYAMFGTGVFLSNLASEGQFALEAIALAVFTMLTIAYSSKEGKAPV